MTTTDALYPTAALALIVAFIALSVVFAVLRRRFTSWIWARVSRSVSRATGIGPRPETPTEEGIGGIATMFDVLSGGDRIEPAKPRERAGTAPAKATVISDALEDGKPR
jgi:hypothetical protein